MPCEIVNAEISRRILTVVASGKELKVAIDEVLGAGTFANVVSELYDALRAKN